MQKFPAGSSGKQPVAGVPDVVNENSAQTPRGNDAAFNDDVAPNARNAITSAIEPVLLQKYLMQSLHFSDVTANLTTIGIIARTGSSKAWTQLMVRIDW